MNLKLLNKANIKDFPKRNAKGEYEKLQGNAAFGNPEKTGMHINNRFEIELTEAEQKVLDGIHARKDAMVADLLKEVNS